MTEIRNDKIGESYFKMHHPSGLEIQVYPKKGYSSTYAVFGTNYGSVDTCFRRSDEADFTKIPEGTAHFLEHKLFESEEQDAFVRYAQTGASANAYTSFDKTAYLFSCSKNLEASLEILLDFVQSPFFTQETVDKEQGIIGQEITMYKDEPNWQLMFNLLRALYHKHPVRIDIAGTIESIAQIDADILYKCYNTFYNLNNMVLCIAGNAEPEKVLEIADRYLKKSEEVKVERVFEDEPEEVVQSYIEQKLPVGMPLFSLGFKEKCETPLRSLKEQICVEILLELIAGSTSELYTHLIEKGLINTSFGTEYFTGPDFACTMFSGMSSDPELVCELIEKKISCVKKEGIDKNQFEKIRRLLYGRTIMGYNDVSSIANRMLGSYFTGDKIYDDFEVFENLKAEDVEAALANRFSPKCKALSIIKPI